MAQNVGSLVVEIGANVAQLRTDMGKAVAVMNKSQRQMQQSMNALKRSATGLFSAMAIEEFARAAFEADMRLQAIAASYNTIEGNQQSALSTLRFLRQESERLGFVYQDIAESAKGFFAATEGTTLEKDTRAIISATLEAGTALSLTGEQIDGVILALGQMVSKGKVSMEELRGQLGERLPKAFQLAAKAMGVTTSELDEMVSSGEVMAEDLLPALAREMHNTFGVAAVNAARNARQEMNRMITAWEDFKAGVSTTDFFVALIKSTTNLLKALTPATDKLTEMRKELAVLQQAVRQPETGLFGMVDEENLERQKRRIVELTASIAALEQAQKKQDKIAQGAGKDVTRAPVVSKADEKAAKKLAKEIEKAAKARKKLLDEFDKEYREATLSQYEFDKQQAEAQAAVWNKAGADRVKVNEWLSVQLKTIEAERTKNAKDEAEKRLAESTKWQDGATRALQEYRDQAEDLGAQVESAVTNSFSSMENAVAAFATGTEASISNMVDAIVADLARIAVRQSITGPLADALGGAIGGYFNSTPSTGYAPALPSGLHGHAKGDVMAGGNISSFSGSVVSKPTFFSGSVKAFANGGNVMGEAGPEAILPLARTSGGKLGVRTSGTGSVTNVIINNNTGGQVTTNQQENETGGKDITIQIDEMMARNIGRTGSKTNKALLASTGSSTPLVRR